MTRKTTEASIDLTLGLDLNQSLGLSLGLEQDQKYLKKEIFLVDFSVIFPPLVEKKPKRENFFFQIFLVLL